MATVEAFPVVLIPPVHQRLWGWPAVANFVLGGLGAGTYAVAVIDAGLGSSPALTLAAWLGPALVLAGFAAVAAEAGRPLRGPRALVRLGTSWMSRELLLGLLFAALAGADLLRPSVALRVAALGSALGLALAQGFIVRRARAVPAWDVAALPLVFLFSALLSGAGLLLVVEALSGRAEPGTLLWGALAISMPALIVWLGYVTWSREPAFAAATRCLRGGPHAVAIVGGGYVVPFACLALAVPLPGLAPGAALLGGALLVAGQLWAKAALLLRAGELRAITLESLNVRRRAS